MVPTSFQTPRALAALNNAAVGLALASLVTPALCLVFHRSSLIIFMGLPTLLCGVLWAVLLRRPETMGRRAIRRGWVLSIPLAVLNASLTAALVMAESTRGVTSMLLLGAFLGATFGAIIWIPALLGTLLCFGVPIARAQRLAKKGLAGAERGELIVGLTCLVLSAVGLLLSCGLLEFPPSVDPSALLPARLYGLLGALAGAATTALSALRESRRRAFVAAAAAGNVKGYRVDATDEGKVLVRIASQGKGYRVADFEEDVFELDDEGEAIRPKHLDDDAEG